MVVKIRSVLWAVKSSLSSINCSRAICSSTRLIESTNNRFTFSTRAACDLLVSLSDVLCVLAPFHLNTKRSKAYPIAERIKSVSVSLDNCSFRRSSTTSSFSVNHIIFFEASLIQLPEPPGHKLVPYFLSTFNQNASRTSRASLATLFVAFPSSSSSGLFW